jgi:hypothetical protein
VEGGVVLKINGIEKDWPVVVERPWLLEIWEPLRTKAPNPCIAQPFCCYSITVIFYLRPYTTREWHHFYRWKDGWHIEKPGSHLEEWDRAETVLDWHSAIEFNGERFEMTSGRVLWKNKRWWMRHGARRLQTLEKPT